MSKTAFLTALKQMGSEMKSYFVLTPDLVSQSDAEAEIRAGVSFKGSQLLVLIFAIFVASLGLNTNSIPVIIGAMLISPLMGPIFGMGLALGVQDFELLRRGLKNIGMAVLGSVVASAIYFLISPQYESSSQLLARTSPSIYDVLIGLFGGAAGILSIVCKNKGQVMPGVAIATSLMPPLCTAGYGLATMQMHFFLGALYLFFTNMIFILFATWTVIKILRYKRVAYEVSKRYKRVQIIVYTIVFATVGLSAYLTVQMIRKNIFLASATSFVEQQMVFPNTQVLNHTEGIKGGKRYIDVTLIGEPLPKDSLQLAMYQKLDSVGLGGTILNIKQGFSLTSGGRDTSHDFDQMYAIMQNQLSIEQAKIDSLHMQIKETKKLTDASEKIAPEIKVLFPTIQDIAISKMLASTTSSPISTDTVSIIFVNAPRGLNATERVRLREFVEVRLNLKNVNISLNPTSIPWPSTQKPEATKQE